MTKAIHTHNHTHTRSCIRCDSLFPMQMCQRNNNSIVVWGANVECERANARALARGYEHTSAKGVNQPAIFTSRINHFKLFALMLHLHWNTTPISTADKMRSFAWYHADVFVWFLWTGTVFFLFHLYKVLCTRTDHVDRVNFIYYRLRRNNFMPINFINL